MRREDEGSEEGDGNAVLDPSLYHGISDSETDSLQIDEDITDPLTIAKSPPSERQGARVLATPSGFQGGLGQIDVQKLRLENKAAKARIKSLEATVRDQAAKLTKYEQEIADSNTGVADKTALAVSSALKDGFSRLEKNLLSKVATETESAVERFNI